MGALANGLGIETGTIGVGGTKDFGDDTGIIIITSGGYHGGYAPIISKSYYGMYLLASRNDFDCNFTISESQLTNGDTAPILYSFWKIALI